MLCLPSKSASIFTLAALLAVASCTSVAPQRMATDRMEYGEVVAESWKRQTLLNVVRLRYADAPVFLDVSSVINSYSVGGRASAGAALPNRSDPDIFTLGADQTWSNTPTITYQPLLGDRFTKSLLQPVPPSAVFQLIQGGWPVDLVMRTVVRSINGLRNDSMGVGGDPEFYRIVEAMSRMQLEGALGIRVEPQKGGGAAVIVLRKQGLSDKQIEDGTLVLEHLGLKPEVAEFDVVFGLFPRRENEVAIISRSMLELMLELGAGMELEADAVSSGRVAPGLRQNADSASTPLVQIHSGMEDPGNTYSSVHYRGRWYWIEDTDFASKRIFTFLMILFSLAETGQSVAAPVVTVPSR